MKNKIRTALIKWLAGTDWNAFRNTWAVFFTLFVVFPIVGTAAGMMAWKLPIWQVVLTYSLLMLMLTLVSIHVHRKPEA